MYDGRPPAGGAKYKNICRGDAGWAECRAGLNAAPRRKEGSRTEEGEEVELKRGRR